jgi:hypothetical protein
MNWLNGYLVVGILLYDVGGQAAGRNGRFFLAGTADFYNVSYKDLPKPSTSLVQAKTIIN